MSIIDALLSEDICQVEDCGNESFRYCFLGCGWRCTEHYCEHMHGVESQSWLSTSAVVARMSDADLTSVRLKLQLQITAIDDEISHRKFNKRPKWRPSIITDRMKVTRRSSTRGYDAIKQFVASLTPDQIKRLEQKLQTKGKSK